MQKALTEMNLQLHHVVANTTGLQIIRAILAGERDPAMLALLRDTRCHATVKALTGHYRAEHLFALERALCMMHTRTRHRPVILESRPS
jgi:transposase